MKTVRYTPPADANKNRRKGPVKPSKDPKPNPGA